MLTLHKFAKSEDMFLQFYKILLVFLSDISYNECYSSEKCDDKYAHLLQSRPWQKIPMTVGGRWPWVGRIGGVTGLQRS